MVPVSREHADFLALAVEYGLLEPDAAVDWACEIVVAEADPLAIIVELAGLIRPEPKEVRELLARVPGSADPSTVFRRVLGLLLQQLQNNARSLDDVTIVLRRMVEEDVVPEELASRCDQFDNRVFYADDGIFGETVDDVRRDLVEFLQAESQIPDSPSHV